MVGTTWKSMSPQEKAPYERVATDELERYMDAKRTFEALHRHYSTLHYGAQEAGVCIQQSSASPAQHSVLLHQHCSMLRGGTKEVGVVCADQSPFVWLFGLPAGASRLQQQCVRGSASPAQHSVLPLHQHCSRLHGSTKEVSRASRTTPL